MGTQPSKLNKVLSRTTTDSSSNSSSRKSKKQHQQQHQQQQQQQHHQYLHKDLAGISLTPISALPLSTPLDPNSDGYSDTLGTDSQLTSDSPFGIVGGGDSGTGAQSESAVSSKTNLSSFLSSIRKGKDGRTVDEAPQLDGDQDQQQQDEESRRMEDLKEQKQQKKINRMKEKAQKHQQRRQQRQQQQQQQQQGSPIPYQNQAGAATWSTFAPLGTPSSPHSVHSSTISSPAAKAKSATGIFSVTGGSRIDPDLPSAPALTFTSSQSPQLLPTTPNPGDAASQSGGRSGSSSPAFFSAFRSGKDKNGSGGQSIPLSPSLYPGIDLSPSSSFSAAPSSTSSMSTPNAPANRPRASFIRGKPGFAWLEKRLPPASMDLDDEMTLGDNNWTYQQGQLLNDMEVEAAKGYMDRITDQHYLMKDVMGGNYHAAVDLAFKRVLENGCGAGDWTLDMASEMPETDFIGCPQIMFTTSNAEKNTPILRPRGLLGADQSQMGSAAPSGGTSSSLSVPDPSAARGGTTSSSSATLSGSTIRPNIRPRNCSFVPDVPLNRLPFPNEQFDFVYQRRQSVVLMSTEWQRTVLELFRVLKRGGWVEIVEPDLFLRGGGELCQLAGEYCVGIFEAMGRNPNVIHEMAHLLENAGFVNVAVKVWSIPLGWGGVIGQAMLVNQRGFVNELEPIYVRQGHGKSEEYRELTKSIFEETVEKKAYINYHAIVGQKPASASERVAHQQLQKQKEEELQRQQQMEQQQQQLLQQEIYRQQQQQLLQQQHLIQQQQQQQQQIQQQPQIPDVVVPDPQESLAERPQ